MIVMKTLVPPAHSSYRSSYPSRCPSSRTYTHIKQSKTIVHISNSHIYRFGDSNARSPVFKNVKWTVNEGEAWAVTGDGRSSLLQTLAGRLRIWPCPPGGLFPFLGFRDPYEHVILASAPGSSDNGINNPVRFGALRDDDHRTTLRQNLFRCVKHDAYSESVLDSLDLRSLLDLPIITLSAGQTRRARIARALLGSRNMKGMRPEMVILDEPHVGLDAQQAPRLVDLLQSLHSAKTPRIILGLRPQDKIPDWITHVANVNMDKSSVETGEKELVLTTGFKTPALQAHKFKPMASAKPNVPPLLSPQANQGFNQPEELLVDMIGVNVHYGRRKVLSNVNWQIREGELWHLQGANGSGKTTLLALISGQHPLSFSQPNLKLFGQQRKEIPTPELQTLVNNPDSLYRAMRGDPTVWDIVSGRGTHEYSLGDVFEAREILDMLGPVAWDSMPGSTLHLPSVAYTCPRPEAFADRQLSTLSPAEKALVGLMRCLVGSLRTRIVLLDEAFSGLDSRIVETAREAVRLRFLGPTSGHNLEGHLRRTTPAVVVVSHDPADVPWSKEDGLRVFRLEGGEGRVIN